MGSKTTPGASEVLFSSVGGKQLVTALGGIAPVGASFHVGTTKGLILVELETLRILLRCLFKEGSPHLP